MSTCKKCELTKTCTGFQPLVGKELSPQAAYNLVCKYAGKSSECLNAIKKFDKDYDNWTKRRTGN